ncbi:MAG: Uma2 family endonuclease [Acidobacteria bacterium]|nr:Uma2 family endonuclease [Acidobacteriota bacterium]MBI3428330.1 Uma2 family endonuclease [Acidobacteriota bacterium]
MTAVAELAVAEAVIDDSDYEIVNGVKEVKMAGALHGRTIMRLGWRLAMHVEQNQLGDMYSPDTTFLIGANERLPDLAFLAKERIPAEGVPFGKWDIAPDLAVEVISPNDIYTNVKTKLSDYFNAGVREVWIVEPETKLVTIYQSLTRDRILSEDDQLTSDLLPGFTCRVGDLF